MTFAIKYKVNAKGRKGTNRDIKSVTFCRCGNVIYNIEPMFADSAKYLCKECAEKGTSVERN